MCPWAKARRSTHASSYSRPWRMWGQMSTFRLCCYYKLKNSNAEKNLWIIKSLNLRALWCSPNREKVNIHWKNFHGKTYNFFCWALTYGKLTQLEHLISQPSCIMLSPTLDPKPSVWGGGLQPYPLCHTLQDLSYASSSACLSCQACL